MRRQDCQQHHTHKVRLTLAPRQSKHNTRGSVLVELACLSVLFGVFAWFAIDIAILLAGGIANDAACRDACRAAASANVQSGQTLDERTKTAKGCAQAAVKHHPTDGTIISSVQLAGFDYNETDDATTDPTVTATTSVDVAVPARVTFMGINFPPQDRFTFKRTYKYPIVKLKLQ